MVPSLLTHPAIRACGDLACGGPAHDDLIHDGPARDGLTCGVLARDGLARGGLAPSVSDSCLGSLVPCVCFAVGPSATTLGRQISHIAVQSSLEHASFL